MNKIFKHSALLLFAALGLVACTEEYDYTAVEVPTTAQAYFSNEKTYDFALVENQSEVAVEVMRVKTEGSVTVDVQVNDTTAAKLFNVPSSVTFAEGESVVTLPISFSFNEIVPDKSYAIDLILKSETSLYGNDSTRVIVKYAPWSDWMPYGWNWAKSIKSFSDWQAAYDAYAAGGYADPTLIFAKPNEVPVYTYVNMMSGTYVQPLLYRKSMLDPTQRQFMLYDWFYGVNLIIDEANGVLTVSQQWSGYTHSTYGNVSVADSYTYWHDLRGEDVPREEFTTMWDAERGQLILDMAYFVPQGYFGYGPEVLQLPGYVLPDYSLELSSEGTCKTKNGMYQIVNMTLGADVNSVSYAWFEGTPTVEDLQMVNDGIIDGSISSVSTMESGRKLLSVTNTGKHCLIAVLYDADGKVIEFENAEEIPCLIFDVEEVSNNEAEVSYTPIGLGAYTFAGLLREPATVDGFIMSKRDDKDDIFMIEQLFAPLGSEASLIFTWDKATNTCSVPTQSVGLDLGNGEVFISDLAYYLEDASAYANYPCTFDPSTNTFSFTIIYHIANGGYYNNPLAETFVVEFDESASAAKVVRSTTKWDLTMSTLKHGKLNDWSKPVWKSKANLKSVKVNEEIKF